MRALALVALCACGSKAPTEQPAPPPPATEPKPAAIDMDALGKLLADSLESEGFDWVDRHVDASRAVKASGYCGSSSEITGAAAIRPRSARIRA